MFDTRPGKLPYLLELHSKTIIIIAVIQMFRSDAVVVL